jgi:hypothetical protein
MPWLSAAPTGTPLEISNVSDDAGTSVLDSMFGSEQIWLSLARTILRSVWVGSGFDQAPAPENQSR